MVDAEEADIEDTEEEALDSEAAAEVAES